MATKSKQNEVIKADEVGFSLADTFKVIGFDGVDTGQTMTVSAVIAEVEEVQGRAVGLAQHLHSMALACKNLPSLRHTFQTIEQAKGWHTGRGKPAADSGTIPAPSLYIEYKSKLVRAAEKGVLWQSKTLNEARVQTAKLEHKDKIQKDINLRKAYGEKTQKQAELVHNIAEGTTEPSGDLMEQFKAAIETSSKVFALLDLQGQKAMIKEYATMADKFKNLADLNQQAQQTEANVAAQQAASKPQGAAVSAH